MAMEQYLTAGALATLAVLAFIVIQRLRTDSDPSIRLSSSTATGSASVLLSGVHVTMMLAGAAAAMLFLAGSWDKTYALPLIAVVAAHWMIEKREASMN